MRFLTWNLAMLERSAQAPQSWQQFHTEDAIRRFVLDLAPDVVCWQELPRQVPFVETLELLPATTRSHSGNLAILVSHDVAASGPTIEVVDDIALLATFDLGGDEPLTVANVHLEPGPGAGDRRLEQLSRVIGATTTPHLVIMGDTNMRLDEVKVLTDARFAATKPPRPTWNSKRNRFRRGGNEFTAYFTRWFAGPTVAVTDVVVHDAPIEEDGCRFHLSDHFPLSGVIDVEAAT